MQTDDSTQQPQAPAVDPTAATADNGGVPANPEGTHMPEPAEETPAEETPAVPGAPVSTPDTSSNPGGNNTGVA